MLKRITLNLIALAALFLLCARAQATVQSVGVVNVNTASVVELQLLLGVGPALAARIVAARPYAAPSDLAKVKGFGGKKRLTALLPYVATSGATTLHAKVHLTKAAALAPCLTDMQCEQRDLSLYPPAARASILRGLADGSVHFEPSESGGEYISEKHATR